MAVLNRDDFFSHLNDRVGNDTSDEALSFIEDMTDTYNDLEQRANGDGENWQQKYHDLDESWKARYRRRFFSSGGRSAMPDPASNNGDEGEPDPTQIKINDLFKPVK